MLSPDPPQPQVGGDREGNLKSSASVADADIDDEPVPPQEAVPPSCRCGPLAGIAEMLSLFCTVPGFWRLIAFQFCQSAGQCLPSIFYLGPLISQVWKDNAAAYSNWANASQFAIAIVGAPLFGMWSDGRPRKTSMVIVATCTFLKYFPFILTPLGIISKEASLWGYIGLMVLTSPFVCQLSGSPVIWAWMTDVLPIEHRETGFAFVFAIGSFATWFTGTVLSLFSFSSVVFLWIGQVFLVLQLLIIVTAPSMAPVADGPAAGAEVDVLSQQKSLAQMLISPFRLVARKRSLRLVCGMAAFVTLPDIAVTYTALPIVLVLMKIDGTGHEVEQAAVSNWFSNFPNIFLVGLFAIIGVCAKRFGPARTLVVWTPISCIFFSGPALLGPASGPVLQCLAGVLLLSPLSIFPPLQALVALLVPPSRVGEAMGAVAACKNLASLIAPLIMGFVTQALANQGRTDLYWVIFPGAALIMLVGAWPFSIMLVRRMAEGTDTDMKWSVWSSVSGSRAAGRSLLGSRHQRSAVG